MAQSAFIQTAYNFAEEAKPFTHIDNEESYKETLSTIDSLMELADDDAKNILNCIIAGLGNAVSDYENQFNDVNNFEAASKDGPADVATLRLLMSQHELIGSDFPEIGDKSLISRILNGERNLTKQHIEKLSARFNINPSLFFD